ncbi:zinc-binding dehydrogenase [Saccharopolyspora sp. NPDC000995]
MRGIGRLGDRRSRGSATRHVPTPIHGPGEVRVRVQAAGVNPIDWKTRSALCAQELWWLTLHRRVGCSRCGGIPRPGRERVGRGGGCAGQGDRPRADGAYAEVTVDLVLDLIGGDVVIRFLQVLGPDLLICVPTIGADEAIRAVVVLHRDGGLNVLVDQTYPLEDEAEAHRALEVCSTTGKLS